MLLRTRGIEQNAFKSVSTPSTQPEGQTEFLIDDDMLPEIRFLCSLTSKKQHGKGLMIRDRMNKRNVASRSS